MGAIPFIDLKNKTSEPMWRSSCEMSLLGTERQHFRSLMGEKAD